MTETNSEQSVSNAPALDQISDLLIEEDAPIEQTAEAATDQEEDTAEEDGGAEEEVQAESAEQEASAEEEEEEDVTWSGVLNVDDSKLALDEDGNFKGVKVKVDGEESDVDLNTLIAGYQTAKSTTQKSQHLADEKRQFDEQTAQAAALFKSKIDEVGKLSGLLKKQLIGEYENTDWQKLRAEQPAEYAAAMTDFQQRKADVDRMEWQIQQEQQQLVQGQQQEYQQKNQTIVQEQVAKTLERFPEWRDREVAAGKFKEMETFASEYGYKPEEFAAIVDHRAIAIIHDAMAAKQGKTAAAKKVMKKVPKFRKATGARPTAKKASKLDALVKRAKGAKGANKRSAQADAVTELLMNG